MLTLSPAVRIYLASGTTDLRRSIDGLSAVVRDQLHLEPLSGHWFSFRNTRGDRLKILIWDHGGLWVLHRRLERGTFAWPREPSSGPVEIPARIWPCCWAASTRADASAPLVRTRRVSAAVLYSLVQSCKLIHVPPFEYFKDVLLRVATHPQRLIRELTPKGWATSCRRWAAG
jgi:hypothetical protein